MSLHTDLTRRDLARFVAAGTLLRFAPPLRAEEDRRVGYCIIGLGRISMDHFMPAVKMSRHARIAGLVSGHRDKAERVAAEYGVPAGSIYSYENCDRMAGNKDIDAVYVALPNNMHAEYTIRAARAGKHVLCEKPMATTVEDCEAMIGACRAAGRKLMIAYRCHLEPTNLRAIQLIREGKLGALQAIESAFGFDCGAGEWRLSRKMAGGGPLMDVGIYSLNACRYLTGEEPVSVEGYASVIDKDGRFAEVEENLSWTMKFPSGVLASCCTTYGGTMTGFFRVHGSKGEMLVQPVFNYDGLRLQAEIQGQPPIDEPNPARDPSHFVAEADHFAECILENNKEPVTPGEEGLRDMKLIEQIYRSCGRA
ncbi:MAG: Gfo/Idh/MocA family oxidoreductase [Bryobacteraceae bacterium]